MAPAPTAAGVCNLAAAADAADAEAETIAFEEPRGAPEEDETEEVEEEVMAEEQKPPAAAPSDQVGGEIDKWPRDDAFGVNVPVQKVGGIIGRKGELIEKLCEETKACVRILDGPPGSNDRILKDLDSNRGLRRHKCLAPWRFGVYKASYLKQLTKKMVGSSANGRFLNDSVNAGNSWRRQKALAPWRFQKYRSEIHSTATLLGSPKIAIDCLAFNKISESGGTMSGSGKKEGVLLKETFGSQMPRRCPPRVRISAINAMHSNKKRRRSINEKTQADILASDLANNKDQETVEASARKRKRLNHAPKSCEKPFSLNIGEDKNSRLTQVSHKSTIANYDDSQYVVAREKVMELLSNFRKTYEQVVAEEEGLQKNTDLVAFKLFRRNHNELASRRKYLGSVPGVQVGDVFHLRVELYVAGLHCHHRHVIDFINQEDKTVTSSIVCSGESAKMCMNSEVFEYSCYGSREQGWRFDGESLALKNSMDMKTPVRIICHATKYQSKNSVETRGRRSTYVYNGLYFVDNFSRKKKDHNQYLFIFQLRRMQGQPIVVIKDLIESKRFKIHSGLYIKDISNGNEKIPISAVNDVDDEPFPLLNYMPKIIYPSHFNLDPPLGCDCVNGCSDSDKCACAAKNGGELPFNSNGAILEAKRLVFECGPSCKCPPSCHNRVSQHGIKVQLQVFKTKLMGWGVRSLTAIPSGSFVSEYVGELLTDEEAAGRATDDYIFSVGNNYYDETLWEGISSDIPALQKESCETEVGYNIDTSERGNVGKFFNHSCTPNLYAQNLLYDHDNKSIPHIVFFAAEDIPPMQELTYHYNYAIDEVHDVNGNIKKKNCYCGTDECTGRLY